MSVLDRTLLEPKVLIVGGGPGGYVAAIRCGQLGMETVLVESERLGGTCLIRGCIPSKAIIHAAESYSAITHISKTSTKGIELNSAPNIDFKKTVIWKDGIVDKLNNGVSSLLKRAKVNVIKGWATFEDAKNCKVRTDAGIIDIHAEHVILATGSHPVELPNLKFGGKIISSTEALSLSDVPKKMVIVGAGYIGLELGGAFAKLGSNVSIVEMSNQILPQYDKALVAPVKKSLDTLGINFHLRSKAVNSTKSGVVIENEDGERITLKADKILVTVGRKPTIDNWGLENIPISLEDGFVKTDAQCATACKNVWAIGDLVGEPMLEHKAAAQGEMVAEIISGKKLRFDPTTIPAICFTDPEIVFVGKGPNTPNTIEGVFPLSANGRALTMEVAGSGGFVRVIANKTSHRILGVQAVGHHISELSAVFTHAVETGSTLEDISHIIHAHPTLGECFHEACLRALDRAVHI